jgi:hypothetical protein
MPGANVLEHLLNIALKQRQLEDSLRVLGQSSPVSIGCKSFLPGAYSTVGIYFDCGRF